MASGRGNKIKQKEAKFKYDKYAERWKTTYSWASRQDDFTLVQVVEKKLKIMENYFVLGEGENRSYYGESGVSSTDREAVKQCIEVRKKQLKPVL